MAKGFGNTWWGSRWLLSLTHIDYENRIPRGATYARAGAVREIKVKGNVISAKVEGRRPRPYSVTIIVPPFFPEDVERLIQGIMERPDIVSKLLKHELDPAVLPRASMIICDSKEAALSETGDLLIPIAEGIITEEDVLGSLGDVINGKIKGRENDEEIIVYETVGVAAQDLVAAKVIYDKAVEAGKGLRWGE